jgi:hypothetical protein
MFDSIKSFLFAPSPFSAREALHLDLLTWGVGLLFWAIMGLVLS